MWEIYIALMKPTLPLDVQAFVSWISNPKVVFDILSCFASTGKILDDKMTIKDYDIEPNKNFVVIMVTKVSKILLIIFLTVNPYLIYSKHENWMNRLRNLVSQSKIDCILSIMTSSNLKQTCFYQFFNLYIFMFVN